MNPTMTPAMTPVATVAATVAATPATTGSVTDYVDQLANASGLPAVPSGTYAPGYDSGAATATAPTPYASAPTPYASAATASTPTPYVATTTPAGNGTSKPTPYAATPTPTPTAAAAKMATLGDVDPNGYIRLALSSLHGNQPSSVLNYTNLAINMQTQMGNFGAVAMLQASNQYVQAIVNPLLNNFGIPDNSLSQAAQYWLVGTILVLLMKANGVDAARHPQPQIQAALGALNTSPPNIQAAITAVSQAVDANTAAGNVAVVGYLQSILKTLNNYKSVSLQRMPLTPWQLSLADFPQLLIVLDGKTSPADYSLWWGGSNTSGWVNSGGAGGAGGGDATLSAWGSYMSHSGRGAGTGSSGSNLSLPDPIQKFLYSRTVLDGAINDMVNYLANKGGYDDLIVKMQGAQRDLNAV